MKKISFLLLTIFLINSWTQITFAQYSFWQPEGESFAIEISLENTDLKRLPIYRNAIHSLSVIDDHVIGGTAADEGLAPFVFVASISDREMVNYTDLDEVISGQRSIQAGFCRGPNNTLFGGTIANNDSSGNPGDGHLLQINVGNNGDITIEDLGTVASGEGVFSMTCNSQGNRLYGITYPSGQFFAHNVETGETETFDDIAPTEGDLRTFRTYVQEPEQYLGAALIEDDEGMIYGSSGLNDIFYFNPDNKSFNILDAKIPEVWGRTSLGQIQSWVKSDDGTLYGGNAGDGQLFELDPSSKKVKNLGKPIMMPQLSGLTFGGDGKLYGLAGGPPGYGHLFSYDEDEEGFHVYGNPQFEMVAPGIEQGIRWRAFNLSAIASSSDGKYIVMGEDESLSQLLIFSVE